MAQDIQRWKNQDFACSAYSLKDMEVGINGKMIGNIVEAIHVEKPSERAYLAMEDFDTMRG